MRSAAILAGGRARRFGGRDKSAAVVDGRPILDRLVGELRQVADLHELLIVGGAATHPAARAIPDAVPESGPLGGVHAALTAAASDAVFVVACDMPFVSAALVERLFALSGEADIVVPETDGRLHPLCGVYRRACLEPITRRLAERRLKMLDLFDDVRTRAVALDRNDHRLVANVNTPGDLAALHGHNEP
jgi:molybdopterin-guanine dinucleotide biosynthesis protein A